MMNRRTRLGLLLCSTALLPGCLTRMLWQWGEGETPELSVTDTVCRVHKVRGSFLAAWDGNRVPITETGAARTGEVEIEFSVLREKETPPEMRDYATDTPGRLILRPRQTDDNWMSLPGAERFRPRLWEFGVYRGSYFTTRKASVPLVFVGDIEADQLGEIQDQTSVPSAWSKLPPLRAGATENTLIESGMEMFASQDWIHLLTGKTGFTDRDTTALAWLDGEGNAVSPGELARQLEAARRDPRAAEEIAGYTLLGRLEGSWGDSLYVRVPLPVIVQGKGLGLARTGDRILWRRSQVWDGEIQPARTAGTATAANSSDLVVGTLAVSAQSMPLLTDKFVYSHAVEDEGSGVLTTLAKCLLTPPAVLLDFVGSTSVFYRDILQWMASGHDTNWVGPIAPEKQR